VTNPVSIDEYVVFKYDFWLNDVRIINVRTDDGINYYYDGLIKGLGRWQWAFYTICYKTTIPNEFAHEAITFTDNNGEIHSYIFTRNGIIKTDVLNRPPDEYVTDDLKTIPIKIWSYAEVSSTSYGDENNYTYVTVNIPEENFLAEAIKALYIHGGLSIDSIWYEGKRIVADLNIVQASRLDYGSMAGVVGSTLLIKTLASFPDITEIKVLVDSEENIEWNHFSFIGIYEVIGDNIIKMF